MGNNLLPRPGIKGVSIIPSKGKWLVGLVQLFGSIGSISALEGPRNKWFSPWLP